MGGGGRRRRAQRAATIAFALAIGAASTAAAQGAGAARDDSLLSGKPTLECQQPGAQLKTLGVAGGKDADVSRFPFIVYLQIKNRNCGGTLVAPNGVVTAAHCVMPPPETCQYPVGDLNSGRCELQEPGDVTVFRPTRNGLVDVNQQRGVKRIFAHPKFRYSKQGGADSEPALDADIAILVLDRPFDINTKDLATLADPSINSNFAKGGECARVAGWGRTDVLADDLSVLQEGRKTNKLQSINLRVVEQSRCVGKYGPLITNNMMCVGDGIEGRNTCKGDSGGPLIVDVGKPMLVGVVSWAYGCAQKEHYTIFTRVGSREVRGWIDDLLNGR
ncbi:MAG: serine protease [Pseudomonadota bacterium]